ncbi:Uncharacterised protein r2_g320 [Pycnogonum litorale]
MINVFSSRDIFKIKRIHTDYAVFRLHYFVTPLIILVFCTVIGAQQYVGDPISCLTKMSDQRFVEVYCWTHSTYLPENDESSQRRYIRYYQWVCFALLGQALLFYFPGYLWKYLEGGKASYIIDRFKLNKPAVERKDADEDDDPSSAVTYLMRTYGSFRWYALKYYFCEFLAFVNIFGQIVFMDWFLDNYFLKYGLDYIRYDRSGEPRDPFYSVFPNMGESGWNENDPMDILFPKITFCEFKRLGSTGLHEQFQNYCQLPLNFVNEKIYVFLWFWFMFLAILSVLSVILRLTFFCFHRVRVYLMNLGLSLPSSRHLEIVIRNGNFGDHHFIDLLKRNTDTVTFQYLMTSMSNIIASENHFRQIDNEV